MQDLKTGEMIPLKDRSQKAMDAALPDRSRQGVVLEVGQAISTDDYDLSITSITKNRIYADIVKDSPKLKVGEELTIGESEFKVHGRTDKTIQFTSMKKKRGGFRKVGYR